MAGCCTDQLPSHCVLTTDALDWSHLSQCHALTTPLDLLMPIVIERSSAMMMAANMSLGATKMSSTSTLGVLSSRMVLKDRKTG